jgi:hypothetical protein
MRGLTSLRSDLQGGGAQMFKVLQLRCHFFVFIAHSSKLESHETQKNTSTFVEAL